MSIIGIDFGNESCYVAAAKAGGIETLANDYSLRATPSYVAFSSKTRILGVAAKSQQITNIKNTLFSFKRLLGRSYDDQQAQHEFKYLPFATVRQSNGSIGIKVNYLNEEHVFSPEQCVAMLLTKLRETAAIALQAPINDCVVSVPSYFTNSERVALLNAASIAGLNCLRLFNETTATALAYGIYKQDLPSGEESPRHVVFVDMGQSALQVFIGAFNRGKLKIIASECEPNIGGRNIDWILADHFCKDFQNRYGLDVKSNPRAFLRLLTEIEKLKKQMSANSTTLPIGVECIMNDRDVSAHMKRAEMEELCADLITKIEAVFVKCLRAAQAAALADSAPQSEPKSEFEIHSVEITGGSTRVPFVKTLIEKVFGRTVSTTLNQDEAVSRGCALQCAILSPAVKVRDYAIQDMQPYPISIAYDEDAKQKTIELFAAGHVIPFAKVLTLMCSQNFSLKAFYSGHVPIADSVLHEWIVKEVKAAGPNDPQKIKIKFRIDHNGILHLISAVQYQKADAADEKQQKQQSIDMETGTAEPTATTADSDDKENGETAANDIEMKDGAGETTSEANKVADAAVDDKPKKKKPQVTSLSLVVDTSNASNLTATIVQMTEEELQMVANDRLEKERIDSKNAVEEYVYELRGKLLSDGELSAFICDKDRDQIIDELDKLENWLYDEGEDSRRQDYCDKLQELKDKGEPIKRRRFEWEMRPKTFEEFALLLQLSQKFCEKWHQKDPQYVHIEADDVEKVRALTAEKTKWLDEQRVVFVNLEKFEEPPKSFLEIANEKRAFEAIVNPIIRKPAPKEESKSEQTPPQPPSSSEPSKHATADDSETKEPSTAAVNGNAPPNSQSQMDTTE